MCWESREREGIVLHDVTYTPPGGSATLVLAQMNLAQTHVPYDNNVPRLPHEPDSRRSGDRARAHPVRTNPAGGDVGAGGGFDDRVAGRAVGRYCMTWISVPAWSYST